MSEMSKRNQIAATLVVWLIIAVLGWMLFAPKKLELHSFQLLLQPMQLQPVDVNNLQFTTDTPYSPGGKWTLIFLGFTNCPDICPLELQKLAQMVKRLQAEKELAPKIVFVSVDPERDSLATLKEYVDHFKAGIIGITGTNTELAGIAKQLAAPYSRSVTIDGKQYLVEAGADLPKRAGDEYTVNHSSRIYLINPKGQYIGSFPPPHDPEDLYHDMKELML